MAVDGARNQATESPVKGTITVMTDIWRMRRVFILVSMSLILTACAAQDSVEDGQAQAAFQGETVVFQSSANSTVVALHLDAGAYRSYDDVSEVANGSDIGDALMPCSQGPETCVAFADLFVMVPPADSEAWSLGGYDFHIADASVREDLVVASRSGNEVYSYGYSPRCGVEWINFSTGRKTGDEVFFPSGRSLFSETDCTKSPAR